MELGVRQIRTAGKGSGSIELTLPADLRDLVGLPCRIMLRDGSRPDIVLQPDLRRAHVAFHALWHAMAIAMLRDDTDIPALPLAAFSFGLQPLHGSRDRPFLCWRDGLALADSPPHQPIAISRTLGAFGQAMATFLDIDPLLAAGFGAACGYLVADVVPHPDGQQACDLAADGLRQHPDRPTWLPGILAQSVNHDAADACAGGAMSDAFWRHAAPLLSAVADLFVAWTADPSEHALLCAAWCRGQSFEMSAD